MAMATISDIQYYLILLFLLLVSIFFLLYLFKKSTKPTLRFPPSPPALPFIGHLHLLRPVISKCLHKISSKHGPLLYLRLGSRPFLIISSSTFATEIFKTNDLIFSERPKISPLEEVFGNSGITTAPYGDYWRFMKKLCLTELFGQRQLERFHGVRHEEVKRFLHNLVQKAYKNEKFDLGYELMKLTNNIICRMAMSTRCTTKDDETQRYRELAVGSVNLAGKLSIATMLGPFKKLGFWVFRKQLQEVTRKYNELLEKILNEHEENAKRVDNNKDLMDILLQVHQDKDAEFKITRSHMKVFFQELFMAGTDTSAHTMEWAMAELINHPNVFKKLREEIESIVGTNRLVEESDIPNLHYLQAVVKETLRLYPIGPAILRESREDCKIGGFDIPKKTTTVINVYSIMRDPKLWENPNEFIPERFLQEKENRKSNNFNFVPFGGGRRMCPGSNLALIVVTITIASMVQCFDWKVDTDKVNVEAKSGLIMYLAHPLLCVPSVHFNPFAA